LIELAVLENVEMALAVSKFYAGLSKCYQLLREKIIKFSQIPDRNLRIRAGLDLRVL
jgi:hypothetical protein